MHILITGGAGFIGSFIAERLLARGDEVVLYDNLNPQVHPQGPPDFLPPGARLVVGDVLDRALLRQEITGADAVLHLAAAVGIAQSLYRVHDFVGTNVAGTGLLLEILSERARRPAKLVVLTSNTEYGEGLYRRPSDGAPVRPRIRDAGDVARHGWEPVCPETGERLVGALIPETAALLAENVYALTKKYQEELALALGRTYGFPVTCLRLFNVYGPRQSLANPYTGVLAIFLSRILAGHPPVVYEDGGQSRDFVSVHDVARAVALALDSPAANGEVFNIASGVARPIGQCAFLLASQLGLDLAPTISGRFRRGDIRHCTADITKARERLGYQPTTSWEAGLAELAQWARSAPFADHFERAQREIEQRGLVT